MKVPEYVLFDPRRKRIKSGLLVYRLGIHGVYEEVPLNGDRIYSEQLDLYLVVEGNLLRLYDAKKGEFLNDLSEERRVRIAAERAAVIAEGQARAERLQREEAERRADDLERRADDFQSRAEGEKVRADDLQAEIERLRAQLNARAGRENES